MIRDKRRLQWYSAGILTALLIVMGFLWGSHALSLYRTTIERQIAEDNDIVKANLSIIIHQVTQQYTDKNMVISQIQNILEALQGKGWNGFACVLDKDGHVLAHPNRNMINRQAPLQLYEPIDILGNMPPPLTELPDNPNVTKAIYKTPSEIIAIDWLPELMTYLCVHKSQNPIAEKITALRQRLMGVGLGLVSLAAFGSWFFVGGLVDRYESHLIRQQRELDQLKTDFIHTVSHELRTPLTSIRWSTDSLATLVDNNNTVQRLLHIITDDTHRLASLIEELLNFSRLDAGKLKLSKQTIDLCQIIPSVAEELLPLSNKKEITLSPLTGSTAPCQADPEQMRRVILNLLDNAIKYTPPGGTITMEISQQENSVQLTVTDTGIGIPEADLPHIFDKFYRTDQPDVQKERGTGLGLAIVKGIVEAHGGTVSVKSQIQKGTTVSIQLPKQPA